MVVESIDVDESSGSKANWAFIQNLKKAGYQLKVYHFSKKDIVLKDISTVKIRENRRSFLFLLSRLERYFRNYLKIELHRPLENTFGFSFTLMNDRNSIVSELKNMDIKPDLVITLSKGGSFRPHHALLQMPEWHSKWLAYMHDPYPMHHYPKPYTWKEPGYEQKETFIRKVSQKAAFSAFPSQLLKEWMGQFYPNFLRTGIIIPHQNVAYSHEKVDFPEYFNPENFNLLHAGNLLGARNPKPLLEAYNMFLNRHPEAKPDSRLIFLGGSNERVMDEAGKIPNIIASEGYLPFKEVYAMQQKTAVNIILEARSEISPFLPGKFPHCVNSDKPMLLLGPEKSEVRRLLGTEYPYWSKIIDSQRISQLIEDLYKCWKISPESFHLKRPDIKEYLEAGHLKKVLDTVLEKSA
ncbi:UDP-glycosyltransferase [Salinimicrobium gaetbulicola]|uniref:UDP-glycosyltransferase n=1 Tax=Salinimicrobium gaetbulicola TaxID=999702 RepID=A0ABW3IIK6_9FLAO